MTEKMPEYVASKDTAVVYVVRLKEMSGWGVATLREWPGGGSVDIQSDYGNYAFTWGAIGKDSLIEFLVDLNLGYAMNKLTEYKLYELDFKGTIQKMKKELLSQRRDGYIDKEQARDAWDDLCENIEGGAESEDAIYSNLHHTGYFLEYVWGDDSCNLDFINSIKPQVQMFWDRIWSCFVNEWKKEIEDNKKNLIDNES